MSARRLLAATLLVALPVVTIACGDTAKVADKTTTTKVEKNSTAKSTTTVPGTGDPGTTGDTTVSAPKTAFADGINSAQDQLTAAGTDICALSKVSETLSSVKDPATPDEAKAAGEFIKKYFDAIADTAPAGQEANGQALKAAGSKLLDQLQASNYDPKLLTANTTALDDPAVGKALGTFFQATQEKCGNTTTTGG